MTASIALLTSRNCLTVTGPDARDFLQGLVSQDVSSLAVGDLRYGALLSPPGRLLFDLFLLGLDDGVLLDVDADRTDALMQRLGLYRLRSQVQIARDNRPVHAIWGTRTPPPVSGPLAPDPRRPALGFRHYGPSAALTAQEDDHRRLCMAQGVGGTRDWPDDNLYPIELNFDLLNGIDFSKGCFVGQETTSRMKRRGTVKTRLLPLQLNPHGTRPDAGAEVTNGDLRAGIITSVDQDRALALMRLDRLDGALSVGGQAVTAEPPDWLPLRSVSE